MRQVMLYTHTHTHTYTRTLNIFVLFYTVYPLYTFTISTGDTKKRELLKNPTKIEEIQEKKILTEIEPLQLAF